MQSFFQVVKALHYLHTELHVIHRDVKPSNILINRKGQVKICDFGISGHLVDSVAKTIEAGCKPYMAVSVFYYSFIGPIFGNGSLPVKTCFGFAPRSQGYKTFFMLNSAEDEISTVHKI